MNEHKNKINWVRILTICIILLFILIISFEIKDIFEEDVVCYENQCIKWNLDNFNECVKLGTEVCGFLCQNEYYLCDGIKLTKNCIELGKIETKPSRIKDVLNNYCEVKR